MKKVLVTICAMVAVLACTKTEVCFDDPSEIAFTPVSKYATKVAEETGTLVSQEFYAWANTVPTSGTSQKYFEKVSFGLNGSYYVGTPSQFWPNATPLKFAGVTKTGSATSYSVDEGFTKITLTNYKQPTSETTAVNDLMWFFDDNSGNGYGKTTYAIAPEMKHACSWISIKVKAHENLAGKAADGVNPAIPAYWKNIKVTGLSFDALHTTGSVDLGTVAVWTTSTADRATTGSNVIYSGEGVDITAAASAAIENVANNVVVLPQVPPTISLTYKYTTPANGTIEETVSGISLNYNGDKAWEAGKHYTYTLTICADEIKIAPTVGDWTPGPDNLTQNVQ